MPKTMTMQPRPLIFESKALRELLQSGALWRGEKGALRNQQILKAAPFMIEEIDCALGGGIQFGQIHEWVTALFGEDTPIRKPFPPHLVLCSLIRNALVENDSLNQKKIVAWIGQDVWPSVHLLNLIAQERAWNWQRHVLFIDAATKQERLSAFRTCLSSPGVLAVIGDASNFSQISTRQLQLAARIGGGIGFLLRKENEQLSSCAQAKWLVEPIRALEEKGLLKGVRALNGSLSWRLSLLKAQGVKTPQSWEVQLQQDSLSLTACRSGSAENEQEALYGS